MAFIKMETAQAADESSNKTQPQRDRVQNLSQAALTSFSNSLAQYRVYLADEEFPSCRCLFANFKNSPHFPSADRPYCLRAASNYYFVSPSSYLNDGLCTLVLNCFPSRTASLLPEKVKFPLDSLPSNYSSLRLSSRPLQEKSSRLLKQFSRLVSSSSIVEVFCKCGRSLDLAREIESISPPLGMEGEWSYAGLFLCGWAGRGLRRGIALELTASVSSRSRWVCLKYADSCFFRIVSCLLSIFFVRLARAPTGGIYTSIEGCSVSRLSESTLGLRVGRSGQQLQCPIIYHHQTTHTPPAT